MGAQVNPEKNERRFRLTFDRIVYLKSTGRMARFLCTCGHICYSKPSLFLHDKAKSCGCLNRELAAQRAFNLNRKHGACGGRKMTPEYKSWVSAKQRCENRNDKAWKWYGGRGIKMCKRWISSFQNFLLDMGTRPSRKHQLDRINNYLSYSPSNCRWVTPSVQQNNKRNNVRFLFRGKSITVGEFASLNGISWNVAFRKLSRTAVVFRREAHNA